MSAADSRDTSDEISVPAWLGVRYVQPSPWGGVFRLWKLCWGEPLFDALAGTRGRGQWREIRDPFGFVGTFARWWRATGRCAC